jgi:F-type H+-transporting ATPase subunit epsilon
MARTFKLQIATPERVVAEEEVVALVAPAFDGYLGVMARHAPMVAELDIGAMRVTRPDGRRELLAVSGGLLSVADNVALVLVEAAEAAAEIDVERAQAAAAREGVDVDRARAAIARAANRVRVASRRP